MTIDGYLSEGPFGSAMAIGGDAEILYQLLANRALSHTQATSACAVCFGDCHFSCMRGWLARLLCDVACGGRSPKLLRQRLEALIGFSVDPLEDLRFLATGDSAPLIINGAAEEGCALAAHATSLICDVMRADDIRSVSAAPYCSRDQEQLEAAAELLQVVLPFVFRNTMPFISGVFVVQGAVESAYNTEAPRLITINRYKFDSTLELAESLLHEALHEKMMCIRFTQSLTIQGYDDYASERDGDVRIPWGGEQPRPFSVARALATVHVYVHLYAFYTQYLQTAVGGNREPEVARAKAHRCLERANWLLRELNTGQSRRWLHRRGHEFLKWLAQPIECESGEGDTRNGISLKGL